MATAALSATMPGSDSQKSLSLLNVRAFGCLWAFHMLESPRAPIYVPICLDDLSKKNLQMVFPKALELGRPGAPPATAALAKADLTCVDWKLAEAADILVDFHSFPEFP